TTPPTSSVAPASGSPGPCWPSSFTDGSPRTRTGHCGLLPDGSAAWHDATMRSSINIPNFGDFADPRAVATLASAAEAASWHALLVGNQGVLDRRGGGGQPFGDRWMLPTAAPLATSRLKLGPLVPRVPRRRPEQLARQVATLDGVSGGRVIFSAGLGGP